MPTYLTPGVYFERADAVVPAITALRTDIAGFVGIAERGPLHQATPVQSWRQFQATFGSLIGSGYLAYAVKGFFENGGRKCYIVRVADRDVAASANALLLDKNGNSAWRIEASSPGVWGDQVAVGLRTTHRAQTRTVVEPAPPNLGSSRVLSVTNFERGTLVRLFQAVAPNVLRVVERVDGERQRLEWRLALPAAFDFTQPIFMESIEYTLTVFWRGRVTAIYEGLSLEPSHPFYAPNVVCLSPLQRSDARDDILPPPPPLVIVRDRVDPTALMPNFLPPADVGSLAADTERPVPLAGGADGLATLSVDDFIGEPEDILESDQEQALKRRGLRALETIDEVSILAIPDIHIQPVPPPRTAPLPPPERDVCALDPPEPNPPEVPPIFPEQPPTFSDEEIFRVQSALVAHCEDQVDRFALLDPPFSAARDSKLGAGAILAWRSRFDSKYAALYFSWLRVLDSLRLGGQVVREVPPSGHVAGIFALTDFQTGVHKAPANTELRCAEDTTVSVDDAIQAGLNPKGINAIRSFPGRGLRLYGARTVSSDLAWRYVNVRRLLIMIEEALDVATQWAVFEPNDVYTRSKIQLAITSFLEALWQRGALAGGQPEEAFFVKCDEDINPPYERDQGRLRVDVGVAPSVPYEFIVLRLGRTLEELEVTEQ
jgi:Bacteriophage tail sheath protein